MSKVALFLPLIVVVVTLKVKIRIRKRLGLGPVRATGLVLAPRGGGRRHANIISPYCAPPCCGRSARLTAPVSQ